MATWRQRGVGIQSSSQIEQELYERARNAATEAQRQGDAQLQAAVAAAAAKPVREGQIVTQTSAWSLRFGDARLEKAYQRKSSTEFSSYDAIAIAGQLAFCFFQIWFQFRLSQRPEHGESLNSFLNLQYLFNPMYGYICTAAISTLVLLLHLGLSKRYSCNRSLSLQYYVGMLWIWETLKVLLTTDEISWFNGFSAFMQSVLISFIYRIPFCMQLYPRIYAFGGQCLAVITRVNMQRMHILMFLVIGGHLVGFLLAHRLDRRARTAFVQSVPRYLLDGSASNTPGEGFSSYRASFSRQMWSIFYPDLFENSESTNHVSSKTSEQSAPRRALGGFAGGFGGVSGLKGPNMSTTSSNHSHLENLSDSSDDDSSSDSEFLERQLPYGVGSSSHSDAPYRKSRF